MNKMIPVIYVTGFVVSCVTDSERNATYLAMGSFLPIVMLCGLYLLFITYTRLYVYYCYDK